MITYNESIELFGVARERTLTAVLEYIGSRTLALNKELWYNEPSGEYTAINTVRKLDKDGIEIQDVSEGASDDEPNCEWGNVPDYVLQEILKRLEDGDVHDYDPDED